MDISSLLLQQRVPDTPNLTVFILGILPRILYSRVIYNS